MKKATLFVLSLFILCNFCACGSENRLSDLKNAYDAAGYETEEPAELEEGIRFLRITVSLDLSDDTSLMPSPDDMVYYEAYIMYYDSLSAAEEAYASLTATGIGGVAVRKGRYILSYAETDPFADGYEKVFREVLGE